MKSNIPDSDAVRAALRPLTYAQLDALAKKAKVGFGTLVKIRSGDTLNPGIDTVRKFMPHLKEVAAA